MGRGGKKAVCLSGREASEESHGANTSIAASWLPELCETRVLSCEPLRLWYFVMGAPSKPRRGSQPFCQNEVGMAWYGLVGKVPENQRRAALCQA